MKWIQVAILTLALCGCAMTPEQRANFLGACQSMSGALDQTSQQMMQQQAINNQREQTRQLQQMNMNLIMMQTPR